MGLRNLLIRFAVGLFFILSTVSCNSIFNRRIDIKYPGFLYDSIVFEIQPYVGNAPYNNQLDEFRDIIEKYKIAPSRNVYFIVRNTIDPNRNSWWRSEINGYEKKSRVLYDLDLTDRHLIMWMGFFPGRFKDPKYLTTIGLKYAPSSVAIMGYSTIFDKRLTVMLHELLHIIGMVDLSHRGEKPVNPEKVPHCNDKRCTMFWICPSEPWLCSDCEADIDRAIILNE